MLLPATRFMLSCLLFDKFETLEFKVAISVDKLPNEALRFVILFFVIELLGIINDDVFIDEVLILFETFKLPQISVFFKNPYSISC